MNYELKPYPFCGGEAASFSEDTCEGVEPARERGGTMKPTNEERREVARMLREMDVSDLGDEHGIIDTSEEEGVLFSRILEAANDYRPGLRYAMSHFAARAVVELFADLIEPTERTCRAEKRYRDDDSSPWPYYVCSECGEELHYRDIVTEYGEESCEMLPYCAECGAKVVER